MFTLESYENSTSSSSESQLQEKESELAKAQITASFYGRITEINAVVGEKCSSSLFTIQDLNSLISNVNIDVHLNLLHLQEEDHLKGQIILEEENDGKYVVKKGEFVSDVQNIDLINGRYISSIDVEKTKKYV